MNESGSLGVRAHLLVIVLVVGGLGAGCSSASGCYEGPRSWPDAATPAAQTVIEPGDQIVVTVRDQTAMSGQVQVGEDGNAVLPVLGAVPLAGRTTANAEADIRTRLTGIVTSPQVRVVIAQRRPMTIGVMGEVQEPGRFQLPHGAGVLDALTQAGGLTEFADDDSILLLRREGSPARIRFEYRQLVCGDAQSNAIKLRHGDVIVVE